MNTSRTTRKRAHEILREMTLREKVQQLTSHWVYELLHHGDFDEAKADSLLHDGIGQITRIGGASTKTGREYIDLANRIQRHLMTKTRLQIPAMVHEECCSGFMTRGATLFPQSIGCGATWNGDLIFQMGDTIRRQMRAVGAHHALAPVLDVTRDARWGRVEETMGEDPYLTGTLGCSYIRGIQGDSWKTGVLATAKHFVGYGMAEGGMNWAPAHLGPRELGDVYFFPFEAAIRTANLASIMNNYGELDGQPCASSAHLFRTVLRDEWKFEGLVVSDYFAINMIKEYHHAATDQQHAAEQAMRAGIDVELPTRSCYAEPLIAAVEAQRIPIELVDDAVIRMLDMKIQLGLFENPYIENDTTVELFDTPSDRALAYDIARDSLVLLKNEGNLLPISPETSKIALIGPSADSWRNVMGDYAYPCHIESLRAVRENDPFGAPVSDEVDLVDDDSMVVTVRNALRSRLGSGQEVIYSLGCDILNEDRSGFTDAVQAAQAADVAVLVMGDRSGLVEGCTSGEARDRARLTLPGVQEDLVRAVAETGTPIILVLINGRPVSLASIEPLVSSILVAWLPGEEGGSAIADALIGAVNPGGKLPISFPQEVGQVPVFYGHKPSGGRSHWLGSYVEMTTKPQYVFGYGLSYTTFDVSNLNVDTRTLTMEESFTVFVEVTNTGDVAGDEVVQLYVHDEEYTITRPVKELKGFVRVRLDPGKTKTVSFTVAVEQLGFFGPDLTYIVEPGTFSIHVGTSSDDIHETTTIEVTGETMEVSDRTAYFSHVSVR